MQTNEEYEDQNPNGAAAQSNTHDSPEQPHASEETSDKASSNVENHKSISELQAQLAELQAKNSALAEQFLRSQADVQNMRRRADEDMAKTRKFAIEGFAESLLPVLDSLEAGLAIQNASAEQIREGAQATLRQLTHALERNKIVEIAPKPGDKFDPHLHQAIGTVPAPDGSGFAPGSIASVLQKGYSIAERVLRPALVMVVG